MMSNSPARTALIVVDVQRAFDQWEAAGKRRNNPHAVARIVDQFRAKKIIIQKFRRRKNYRRRKGHRQPHTMIQITSVGSPA